MKNLIVVILFLSMALSACSNKVVKNDEFRISGTIEGLIAKEGSFRVQDISSPKGYKYEKIKFTNGKFEYVGKVSEPTVYKMWITSKQVIKSVGRGYIPVKCASLFFIAYPGADIKVLGNVKDFVNAYPFDGGENDKLAGLNKKLYPVMNQGANLMVRKGIDKSLSKEEIDNIEKDIASLYEKENKIRLTFLKQHPSSIAALWLVEDMVIRSQIAMDEVKKYLEKVDEEYYNNAYYKALKTRVEGYMKTKAGSVVDFKTKQTIDGEIFDIKSLRGKYVIFDFWGTWCGACCAGMPHLLEFRNKHIDNLEVIAVNCGDSKDRWIKSKYTKDYNWIHIKSDKKDNNFVNMFNVQGYPTKIFLDKEGKIRFRTVGDSKEFYDKIEKVINE